MGTFDLLSCEKAVEAVEAMLESLEVVTKPRIHVWNKSDLLPSRGHATRPAESEKLSRTQSLDEVWVSALTGEGLEALKDRIDHALQNDPLVEEEFVFPASDGAQFGLLHSQGVVISTQFEGDRVRVRARVTTSLRDRIHAKPRRGRLRKTG